MNYQIKWDTNNPIVEFNGSIDFYTIEHASETILKDNRFEKMRYQIFDFSQVKEYCISKLNVEMICINDKQASSWNKNSKGAIVIDQPELEEMINYYKEQMENSFWQVRIFKTREEADRWVGLK